MSDSVLLPTVITIALMIAFVIVQEVLRKDAASRTMQSTEQDKGTTRLIGAAVAVSWTGVLLAAILDHLRIGLIEPYIVLNIIGALLMAAGIAIRIAAARTLGRYYTRTLRIGNDQHVITSGLYKRIRHPGYLGDILLFVAAGISMSNVLLLVFNAAIMIPIYIHRMNIEEELLSQTLGREYRTYMIGTKRIIPYIY